MSGLVKNGFVVVALIVAMQASANGQVLGRASARNVPNWIGGGVTVNQAFSLRDGSTNSVWDFDSSIGYWADYEHPTSNGILLGMMASYARPRLLYTSGATSNQGQATITQFMGVLKSGKGFAFHPVYQLSAGFTGFSHFSGTSTTATDSAGNPLAVTFGPTKTDYDVSFSLGYGVGFGISPTSSIEVIEEIGTVLHQKTGLPAGSGNYPRLTATRLGARFTY